MCFTTLKSVRLWWRGIALAGILCATLTAPVLAQNDSDIKTSSTGAMDLTVQDADLAKVLQMLSIQGKKNIIASKSVSGSVTANLYDVTFYEALEAILTANGYQYLEKGNFIYVYSQSEYQEIIAATRKRGSRIFNLDYLSANDAHEFILPLLSDIGKASFRGDVEQGFKPDINNGGADDYAFAAKLVVNDYTENLDQIASLLEDLDTAPQQILLESAILQSKLNETNAFGIDFTVLGSIGFNDLHTPLGAVNNLLAGDDPDTGFQPVATATAAVSTVGNVAGAGGLKVGVIKDDIGVFLRILDEVTDTSVLARPKLLALNRQRAEVLVGTRIGYLSSTATQTSTTQTVEFLDTGIQLVFRPFISSDGMVRMELAPSVSEASLRTVTDSSGTLVTIPDEITNELTTNIRVHDGETAVLGGLFRESTSVSRRNIPLLGDLPIIGGAFRGTDDTVARSEIIFLITPTIIHDEALWAMGEDTLEYSAAVQVGARNGLLPFSSEYVTLNYNQDATDAYNQGDTKMAMYYIDNSLRMNPNQPEMIRFRREVSGASESTHERSMMERTLNKKLRP